MRVIMWLLLLLLLLRAAVITSQDHEGDETDGGGGGPDHGEEDKSEDQPIFDCSGTSRVASQIFKEFDHYQMPPSVTCPS